MSITVLFTVSWLYKTLILHEIGWRVFYKTSLHNLCNTSVILKLFQNKVFKKTHLYKQRFQYFFKNTKILLNMNELPKTTFKYLRVVLLLWSNFSNSFFCSLYNKVSKPPYKFLKSSGQNLHKDAIYFCDCHQRVMKY